MDLVYLYFGGNVFGWDKYGWVIKDDVFLIFEMVVVGFSVGEGNEYIVYVYYEFDFL